MAEIRIVPEGKQFAIPSFFMEGCRYVDDEVAIRFVEKVKDDFEALVDVKLTKEEAANIMGSIALFLGYDFVKKEGF